MQEERSDHENEVTDERPYKRHYEQLLQDGDACEMVKKVMGLGYDDFDIQRLMGQIRDGAELPPARAKLPPARPMKKIYKYPLHFRYVESVYMPAGARILSLTVQNGLPRLWVLGDPEQPTERRGIVTFVAGQDILDDPGVFIGTYEHGTSVFHVFEARNNAQDFDQKT